MAGLVCHAEGVSVCGSGVWGRAGDEEGVAWGEGGDVEEALESREKVRGLVGIGMGWNGYKVKGHTK